MIPFNVPNLPFDDLISPHIGELETKMNTWIQSLRDYPDSHKTKLRNMKLAHFSARLYPYADLPSLETISILALWIILNDDVHDGKTGRQLETMCRQSLQLLDAPPPADGHYAYSQLLSLFGQEVRKKQMSPRWMERFKQHLFWYLKAMQWAADFDAAAKYPGEINFTQMRLKAGGVLMFTDLIELAIATELPLAVIRHPVIEHLTEITNYILCVDNDIFSLEKEQLQRETMNLVLVLQNEHGCTIGEALNMAVERHNRYLAAYLELRETLPGFGIWAAAVDKYVYGLETWMQGHLTWMQKDTERYLVN
ncbi:terpene synthase family protein [Chitinophaga japonensis]|uniref:Terpene synthase n=1 Tax=Chitinophaga japonensis TaxID=104662 RepID=A0A562SZ08_CHIJA|nr:terpene synthase family protein [Chitinophaga japonensis]TWI86537.1 hypothetical protein LX66_3795 [Chitinophaga japonensis]